MPGIESSVNSLVASRPIEPSRRVAEFLAKVTEISVDEIGARAAAFHRIPQSGVAGEDDDTFNAVPIPIAEVYSTRELQLPLFERYAPVSLNLGGLFASVQTRLSTPYQEPSRMRETEREESEDPPELIPDPVFSHYYKLMLKAGFSRDIPDISRIPIQFDRIVPIIGMGQGDDTLEYGLAPVNLLPQTDLLVAHARIISDTIQRFIRGAKILYPASHTSLALPLVYMPAYVPLESRQNFVGRVQSECLSVPLRAMLGDINWSTNTRSQ
jgi:hypothetical protein